MSFVPSQNQNRMDDRSSVHEDVQNLFIFVMDDEYELPDSAVVQPLEGNARTKYGDYVFYGVSYACEVFREDNPRYFEIEGPLDIARCIKAYIEHRRSKMIKELFLHEAGILTFRLDGRWIAERINNMLTNGMDTWAPKFFNREGKASVVFIMGPRMMTADLIRSICIRDVLANIYLYSGVVDVGCGDFDDLALRMVRRQFTIRQSEIVGKGRPDSTSYFRVQGVVNEGVLKDFYNDLATLWYGFHKQRADLMICMTPHRLRGYIQQCHVAATKEDLLPVDWDGINFCGFRTFSGEQQEMFKLWKGWTRLRDSRRAGDIFEILARADYSEKTFFQLACKFTCLKRVRLAECTFNYEDLLIDSEGNTFGYILRTLLLVRCVIRKVDINSPGGNLSKLEGIERELGLQLVEFTDAVEICCNKMLPVILCDYLCDLSKLFTRYYELLDVRRPSRNTLSLCTATEKVMDKCCHLLGINTHVMDEEWRATLMSSYGRKEPRPTDYPIIPLSEYARFEGLNPRFEIFSMNVRVEHSPFDTCSIYGNVLVLDTYRSRADGWVGIDKYDNCFVSYFKREWYEPEHISNDSCIPFGDPSCLHSVPFGSSIEVQVRIQATSDDKDQTYQLTNCKGAPPLLDFWSRGSALEYGTLRYEGIDGRVYLNYGLIRDALDTKLELKLTNVTSAGAKVSGDIVAYYGDAALGDRGLLGHYYALIFRANPTIGLKDEDLPLLKSTLAVPVNGCLTIKACLTDVNSGKVIVDKNVEFFARQDDVDIWEVESILGIFTLKVNWLSGSSQSGSSQPDNFWEPLANEVAW